MDRGPGSRACGLARKARIYTIRHIDVCRCAVNSVANDDDDDVAAILKTQLILCATDSFRVRQVTLERDEYIAEVSVQCGMHMHSWHYCYDSTFF